MDVARSFETRWGSRLLLAAALTIAGGGSGMAAQVTATVTARVEVVSTCTVSDAELDFGTYVAGQTNSLDATAVLQVSECPVRSVRIELDGGGSGNVRNRRMQDGNGNTLAYQIYSDPGMKQLIGTGRNARSLSVGTNNNASLTLYGRIPGGQVVDEGTYTDTVRVTMSF